MRPKGPATQKHRRQEKNSMAAGLIHKHPAGRGPLASLRHAPAWCFYPWSFRIIAVLYCLAFAPAAGKSAELQEAKRYYNIGQTTKAIETCIAALNRDPADETLYGYVMEIVPEGPSKYSAPLRAITDKALALKADGYIYHLGLCKLYRGAGRLPEAISSCRKARSLTPTAWPVYRELGLTYSANGENARAMETLEQGAGLFPGYYKAHYYLAAEYELGKKHQDARKSYLLSLNLLKTENNAEAMRYSGLIQDRLKRLEAVARTRPQRPATPPPSTANPPKNLFKTCMREAEEIKKTSGPAAMEKKLAICETLDQRSPEAKIDRAGFLILLGKYEEAVTEYQKAAGLLAGNGAMTSFCHLKTAQTYSKLNDAPKAVLYYKKTLEINKNDLNAMLGLAAAYETNRENKLAGDLYARVLTIEPANEKARARLDEIGISLLSDSQLLTELRERGTEDDGKIAPSPEDLRLLKTIRLAERNNAVEYLRSKTTYIKGLVTEKPGQDPVKLILTLAGFKSYLGHLTRDAVSFFEKKNITLRDIFLLRDVNGNPLFESDGRLTLEGMQAYWQARNGAKTWLMPYEISRSPDDEKLGAEAKQLIKAGFREISEPEYLWLMKATECPEDVLKNPPCGIKLLKSSRIAKYFLCYSPPPVCTQEAATLSTYIERYRSGKTSVSELDRSTAFFGTGGVEKKRFCHDGKIWGGE
jgi:tetratricopeptide (TPR) repeat protein